MSRFLIATVPVPGHVNPGLPIAHALVQRGHEVRWYAGRAFQSRIAATGARFLPMHETLDDNGQDLDTRYPGRKGLTGLAGMKWDIKHVFLDAMPTQVAELRKIVRDFPTDVILADPGFMGVGALRPGVDPVYAHYGISALTVKSRDTAPFGLALPPDSSPFGRVRNQVLHTAFQQLLFRDVNAHANGLRAQLGAPPLRGGALDAFSPFLYLQASTPSFEYPRSDLPEQVHFIGPLLPETPPDFAPPAWWGDLDAGKPVVLVNQGTIATELNDLIVPTLQALAGMDVLVIATTGGAPAESLGVEVPANARVVPFVPFAALLPRVDVMLTNGGYGGVQFALAHGVPLIVAGTTEEKPEIAARVAWSGAGINLKTKAPTPEQIRNAVRDALDSPHYRYNARRIQADYAQHNAPQGAAALLEQLAATKQPVLRQAAVAERTRQAAASI
ncbi:MAG: glycosyl transferase [Roseiflexaceae bacterium]|nr:glycosyl transferase [Roseiflexaceae bacterium]